MRKIFQSLIFWGCAVLTLTSCDHEYFYQDAKDFEGGEWAITDPAVFEFEANDTTSYLDFYLDLRNNDAYPYQNIYTFIEMEFPNNRSLRDTMHFPYLASDAGKWLGKGIGGAYDNSIMYKHHKKLPLTGPYKVTVTHAMRDKVLLGIERVGIHIEVSRE